MLASRNPERSGTAVLVDRWGLLIEKSDGKEEFLVEIDMLISRFAANKHHHDLFLGLQVHSEAVEF